MRPRKFDIREARKQALDIFWSKGYEATSLDDLCCAMDISRSSFYQAFGCKHDLLCSALDDYANISKTFFSSVFEKYTPVQEAIRAIFENAVLTATVGKDNRGCFIGNMAAELAPQSTQDAAIVRTKFDIIQKVFEKGLKDAQDRGELVPESDPEALAWFLVSSFMGLKLLSKTNPDRAAMQPVIEQAVQLVR